MLTSVELGGAAGAAGKTSRVRKMLAAFLVLFAGLGWVGTASLVVAPQAVYAQDEAAAEGEAAGDEEVVQESMLEYTYRSLGLTYTVAFLLLSFLFVAFFAMNLLALRRDQIVPLRLVETFEGHIKEKRYQEAYELAKADDSFLGKTLSAGLGRLSQGYQQAVEGMQEVADTENMKMEHRLSYLALIGTIAPMVGLLGTVDGMVRSFSVIATSNTTPKPSELADGISTALITTLAGLIVAIPAIVAFNLLKNRLQQLMLEAGILSEQLMGRFQNVGKKA
ncbi:MAG TPA: MotA/TolQ/ExbB proton channel family protein [Pirellulales bacterium]